MSLVDTLRDLRRFVAMISPTFPAVDLALVDLRALLDAAGIEYRLVGGIAVIHHGYVRSTRDVDVLVQSDSTSALDPLIARYGFERETRTRLKHIASGVQVDLLIAGDPEPRRGTIYPEPSELEPSRTDEDIVGLPGLVMLKMRARRMQDLADVVRLLKHVSDGEYLDIEVAVDREQRSELARMRDEALQELAWDKAAAEEE